MIKVYKRGVIMSETTRINMVIPTELKERLEKTAKSKGLNMSALIRLILMENLDHEEGKNIE